MKSLGTEIADALNTSDGALAITESVGEMLIDELLDDEFLASVPVLTWIIGAKNVYTAVSDKIYLAKVAAMLAEMQNGTWAPRTEDVVILRAEPEQMRRFSDSVVHQLDRLDGAKKAAIQGRMVRALFEGEIDFRDYRHLSHALQSMFVDDLVIGETDLNAKSAFANAEAHRALEQVGLCQLSAGAARNSGDGVFQQEYSARLTHEGRLFADILRKPIPEPKD